MILRRISNKNLIDSNFQKLALLSHYTECSWKPKNAEMVNGLTVKDDCWISRLDGSQRLEWVFGRRVASAGERANSRPRREMANGDRMLIPKRFYRKLAQGNSWALQTTSVRREVMPQLLPFSNQTAHVPDYFQQNKAQGPVCRLCVLNLSIKIRPSEGRTHVHAEM